MGITYRTVVFGELVSRDIHDDGITTLHRTRAYFLPEDRDAANKVCRDIATELLGWYADAGVNVFVDANVTEDMVLDMFAIYRRYVLWRPRFTEKLECIYLKMESVNDNDYT